MDQAFKITIGENGRMCLPTKVRNILNLSAGDQIMLVINEEARIIPLRNAVKEFQDLIKSHNPTNISLVDSLLETRKFESYND